MKKNINVQENGQATARAFIDFLRGYVGLRERVTIALSGGSTPKLLFDMLAEAPSSLEWHKIHFFWGDERCVPPDHADSNYKMTHDHLLQHIDIPAENIHRIKGEADPEEEAERYGKEILEYCGLVDGLPSIDLITLGMGDDGHTASIFPQQMELLEAPTVCAVATHPDSGQRRVTLTGPVINNAHTVAFLVTGNKKAEKIRAILGAEGSSKAYPAGHIVARKELCWFMDHAAYGELD